MVSAGIEERANRRLTGWDLGGLETDRFPRYVPNSIVFKMMARGVVAAADCQFCRAQNRLMAELSLVQLQETEGAACLLQIHCGPGG